MDPGMTQWFSFQLNFVPSKFGCVWSILKVGMVFRGISLKGDLQLDTLTQAAPNYFQPVLKTKSPYGEF